MTMNCLNSYICVFHNFAHAILGGKVTILVRYIGHIYSKVQISPVLFMHTNVDCQTHANTCLPDVAWSTWSKVWWLSVSLWASPKIYMFDSGILKYFKQSDEFLKKGLIAIANSLGFSKRNYSLMMPSIVRITHLRVPKTHLRLSDFGFAIPFYMYMIFH